MDAGILIIFLCSFIILFCVSCLCCSIFSDNEEEIRNLGENFFFCVIFTSRHYNFFFLSSLPERRQQRSNQEQPCVIEMEQPKKKTSVTSVKSPAKSKLSLNEEPPPTYEEWLHLSGQVTPDF